MILKSNTLQVSPFVNQYVDKFVNSGKVEKGLKRTNYIMSLVFNGLKIDEVIIDPHYKINHPEMNDDLILELVKKLSRLKLKPTSIRDDFYYFVEDPLYLDEKPYRLIITLEQGCHYIGVVNAFRVKEKNDGIPF